MCNVETEKTGFTLLGPRNLPCWYYSSTPHTLYKNSSTISCKEKEKPSIAMTRSIYPGWLLNGSLTVIEGPANLRAEADVFVAPDAEQMRGTFLVAIENWNILPFGSLVVSENYFNSDTIQMREVCSVRAHDFVDVNMASWRSASSFGVKQPVWGRTLAVWKEGGVSPCNVNTSK